MKTSTKTKGKPVTQSKKKDNRASWRHYNFTTAGPVDDYLYSMLPKRDYDGMAFEFRKMKRVWAGTSIQAGMYRRRDAEAKLLVTP